MLCKEFIHVNVWDYTMEPIARIVTHIYFYEVPEDPVNSAPDVPLFFISGRPVRGTMFNMFCFENFGVHFDSIKTGT